MAFYIENKSRSCTIGISPKLGKRVDGNKRRLELAGMVFYSAPGDVQRFEDRAFWNVMSMMSDDTWVACDDPAEMDELGVPDEEIPPGLGGKPRQRRQPGGFYGARYVLRDSTDEAERRAISSSERIASANRLNQLESDLAEARAQADAAAIAKAEAEQLRAAVEAQRRELDALKASRPGRPAGK